MLRTRNWCGGKNYQTPRPKQIHEGGFGLGIAAGPKLCVTDTKGQYFFGMQSQVVKTSCDLASSNHNSFIKKTHGS